MLGYNEEAGIPYEYDQMNAIKLSRHQRNGFNIPAYSQLIGEVNMKNYHHTEFLMGILRSIDTD